MKFELITLLVTSCSAFAVPGPAVGAFYPATKTDKRSPCPMINTLQNHGYLPRDGSSMTRTQLVNAISQQANVDPLFVGGLFDQAMAVGLNDTATTVNDVSIAKHNVVEHDASLFRQDLYFGDNIKADPALLLQLLSYSKDKVNISIDDLARFRRDRLRYSKQNNPTVVFGALQDSVALGESALLSLVLSPENPELIPKNRISAFAGNERLPISEGWKKSSTVITKTIIDAYKAKLAAKIAALGP